MTFLLCIFLITLIYAAITLLLMFWDKEDINEK